MIEKVEKRYSPDIAINLGGPLLWTVNGWSLRRLGKRLNVGEKEQRLRIDKACALPVRGLKGGGAIERFENETGISIVLLEDAWNPTDEDNIAKALLVAARSKDKAIWDGLFPSRETCGRLVEKIMEVRPNSRLIVHEARVLFPEERKKDDPLPSRLLLEINPGIKMKPEEILGRALDQGIELVFDPSHLLPSSRMISLPDGATKVPEDEAEWQLKKFAKGVGVFDFNAPDDDIYNFLEGKGKLKGVVDLTYDLKIRMIRLEMRILPDPIFRLPHPLVAGKSMGLLKEVVGELRKPIELK